MGFELTQPIAGVCDLRKDSARGQGRSRRRGGERRVGEGANSG